VPETIVDADRPKNRTASDRIRRAAIARRDGSALQPGPENQSRNFKSEQILFDLPLANFRLMP
jgi:hypothetical protein